MVSDQLNLKIIIPKYLKNRVKPAQEPVVPLVFETGCKSFCCSFSSQRAGAVLFSEA